jgi:hypothetical protein
MACFGRHGDKHLSPKKNSNYLEQLCYLPSTLQERAYTIKFVIIIIIILYTSRDIIYLQFIQRISSDYITSSDMMINE